MKEQIIITIGRESGSGGHAIAKKIADEMGIECYDKKRLVEGTAKISGMDRNYVKKLDEKPVGFPFSGRIGAFEDSPESNVARKTFEYIRQIAASGESCVIVGRCADYVLDGRPNVVRVFLYGNLEDRIVRKGKMLDLKGDELKKHVVNTDKKRARYYRHYTGLIWGEKENYDLCINTSKTGIEGAVASIKAFIKAEEALLQSEDAR